MEDQKIAYEGLITHNQSHCQVYFSIMEVYSEQAYTEHLQSFNDRYYEKDTELSTEFWRIKDTNCTPLLYLLWGYPLSTYAKFSEKLTLLTPWYVRNVSFSKDFAYVPNGWPLPTAQSAWNMMIYDDTFSNFYGSILK